MATGVGLTLVKQFSYRSVNEEWSNHYHLTGTVPADAAAWRTLFNAVAAAEAAVYDSQHVIVAGYGYDDDSPTAHAVWSVDLTVSPNTPMAGTGNFSPAVASPGDAAAWIRWKLDRVNSKGKPIFLRKYFHGVKLNTSGGDSLVSTQRTAYLNLATLLSTGAGVGGAHIRDTGGGAVVSVGASNWVTTRTLKRRGKRPPTG